MGSRATWLLDLVIPRLAATQMVAQRLSGAALHESTAPLAWEEKVGTAGSNQRPLACKLMRSVRDLELQAL